MVDKEYFPEPEWSGSIASKDAAGGVDRAESTNPVLWRVLAVIGVLLLLAVSASNSTAAADPGQKRSFLVLLIMLPLVLVVMRFVFRESWNTLWRHADLLVPLGVVSLVLAARNWLLQFGSIGSVLESSREVVLINFTLHLSLGLLLEMVIWVAFAAWQTGLLLQWVRTASLPTLSPFPLLSRNFWPALACLGIGVTVLMLLLIPVLAVAAGSMVLAIPLLGLLAVGWNMATLALLPVCLAENGPLLQRIRSGFRTSWKNKRRWAGWLIVHLLLLGVFVAARASTSTQSSSTTSVGYSINAFWVGGYENNCRWLTIYMDQVKSPALPLVATSLQLLFLVLAVAIKLALIRDLFASMLKQAPVATWQAYPAGDPYRPPL
jgi:hypothetical protein